MRHRFVVLAFLVAPLGLPGQGIPSGEVPARERQPRTMIGATVLAVLANHDRGAKGADFSIRGPRRTNLPEKKLPGAKPARPVPSKDPAAEVLEDVTCTLNFRHEREPRRLASELLLELVRAFDRSKIWRVRQLVLERGDDDGKWSAAEFQVGFRQARKGRDVEYHELARVADAVAELIRIANEREEREAVRISLDTFAAPAFQITYRLGATNAENQRKALHAELAATASREDGPLRLVALDLQGKPEKVGDVVTCAFAFRLRERRD